MKKLFLFFLFCCFWRQLLCQNMALQNGDLLFQIGRSSDLTDAISASTATDERYNYTHVGIVCIEHDSIFVIEATPPCVSKTPLSVFLNNSAFVNEKPLVAVARLNRHTQRLVDLTAIVKKAHLYLGQPYDYIYSPNNEAYYCSELVYLCYCTKKHNKPIFKTIPMTFKNKNNDFSHWIEHFAFYNAPIPEGEQGTNPQQLSRSKKIQVVFRFFD